MESKICTSVKRIVDSGCVPMREYGLGWREEGNLMEAMGERFLGGPV